LDNGLCRKISCGQYQYVHSLKGCLNCNVGYPNSLSCDAYEIKSCKENYVLEVKQLPNGAKNTTCKTCADTAGYKIIQIAATQVYNCVEICGDGIVINDLCDDGNTLNGDGCSENCKI